MSLHLFFVPMRQFLQSVILNKTDNMRVTLTLRSALATIVAVGKQYPKFVPFVIKHAMRMNQIVIYVLSDSTTFFNIIS
jgi:hypothetical protein